MIILYPVLNIEDPDIPLPHVQGVADIKEFFLSMELQFVKGFRPRLAAKAVELLPVDANDVSQIAVPAEDGSDHSVEFWEIHVIRHREKADDHGAYLTENCSQNQTLEGACSDHCPRLLAFH